VLDRWLDQAEFVGGEISTDEFAILGWAWRHDRHQIDLAHFPNVGRWYETLMARPARF
jgi:GSH-dependent disulfide-bond oxidoreductase